jgi:dTDP-4-amino-4,6-dideoxygalactose transaminase
MSTEQQAKEIPLAVPDIGEEEIAEVAATMRSGWITTGPRTAQFEKEFRSYVGAPHALALNSGSAALHLALVALGITRGDEVITTALTFCATVNAILETGATPVLADTGPDFNIDPAAAARLITPRTRAILPVHLAGLACDMKAIWELAREHGLKVVEDAAHAVGTTYRQRKVGSGQSDAVAFSFYATKNLTTGEGGMVTTPSDELEQRMRVLSRHGINYDAWSRNTDAGKWHYDVTDRGFKYNMSDIQAAIGIHQLRKLERNNARRAEIAMRYDAAFRDVEEVETAPGGSGHAWHLYILRLNLASLAIDRSAFIEEMGARGIGCGVHFIPIPLHTHYKKILVMRDPCKHALAEYTRQLSIPIYSKMLDCDVDRVIDAVKEIVMKYQIKKRVAIPASAVPPA